VNYPILQVTGNLIIRPDKFPAGFGQKSRDWVKTSCRVLLLFWVK
jgi:hypothetical protein